jgi:para-nitrobenzyl esterase
MIARRCGGLTWLGRLVAVLAAVAAASPSIATADTHPVIRTEGGLVRGFEAERVDKFLGLPYAAPPIGARRWAPPARAEGWTGVRDATRYSSRCAQLASGNGARSEREDCLFLNVYRPAEIGSKARLPVLFWIHGGGLRVGAGDQHDGTLLARTNDIVVVSINYRLGVFGFLGHPALSAEGSGNYGLLDQQAALRWVRRNIGEFGGDRDRVTIAGESAGAFSVCANLVSPKARGLFARAIMQSGGCPSRPLAETEAAGAAVAEQVGCADPAAAAACLRSKPASALLDAGEAFMARLTSGDDALPVAPGDAVAAGHFPRVPMITGVNRDEGRYFAQQQGWATLTEQQYGELVGAFFGGAAPAVLAEYPYAAFPAPYAGGYAIGAVITDSPLNEGLGGCPAQDLAATLAGHTRTWFYEFADREAPGLIDDPPGFDWGAAHTLELGYMWPSFHYGTPLYPRLTPRQLRLSDEMVRYWGAFVRSGMPAVPRQPPWPSHRTGDLLSLRPGGETTRISAGEYGAEHNCRFWDALGGDG